MTKSSNNSNDSIRVVRDDSFEYWNYALLPTRGNLSTKL